MEKIKKITKVWDLKELKTYRVVIITEVNQKIAFALAQKLCEPGQKYRVVVTAQEPELMKPVFSYLERAYPDARQRLYRQILDLDDLESVQGFTKWLEWSLQGFDVLINNGAYWTEKDLFPVENKNIEDFQLLKTMCHKVEVVMALNNLLLPYLKKDGKIINVVIGNVRESLVGAKGEMCRALDDPKLTEGRLREYMGRFIQAAEHNELEKRGWGNSSFIFAKNLLDVYTRYVLVNQVKGSIQQVYSVDPGYSNFGIVLTDKDKAEDIFFLVDGLHFDRKEELQGQCFRFKEVLKDKFDIFM